MTGKQPSQRNLTRNASTVESHVQESSVISNVKKLMSRTDNDVNSKAVELLLKLTKMELAEEVGLSRPTLDSRLNTGKWKKLEVAKIESLYGKYYKR